MSITNKDYNVCSGKLYCIELPESGVVPEDLTAIATEENRLAHIKGGGTLTYSSEFYEDKDDLEEVSIKFPTKVDVTFKTKFITWNGALIEKLCQTATVDSATTPGVEDISLGGPGDFKDKRYIILFIGEGASSQGIKVLMVGYNKSGFDISFVKETATQPEMEFVGEMFTWKGKQSKARILRGIPTGVVAPPSGE